MTELSGYDPADIICLGLVGALLLRRLVLMERFHWPRVVILTALLSLPVVYLFHAAYFPPPPPCPPAHEDCEFFTYAEM